MKTVSLAQAFAHCASTGSYWLWIGIAVIIAAIIVYLTFKASKTNGLNATSGWLFFAALLIVMMAVLMRPVELAQNTTKEQASRGVWIGY